MKGEDEEVTYELDAPKLIVEKTFETVQSAYEFKASDYPELSKCKWITINIDLTNCTFSGYLPAINVLFDNKIVFRQESSNQKYFGFKIQEINGLWNCDASSRQNIGTGFGPMYRVIDGASVVKYAPISNSIKLTTNDITNCLTDNATIKIYGFY